MRRQLRTSRTSIRRQAAGAFWRDAPSPRQGLASQRYCLELLEPRPQPFELPPAHAALLGRAVGAVGQHVELLGLRDQLYPHAGSGLAPACRGDRARSGSAVLSVFRPGYWNGGSDWRIWRVRLRWECRGPSQRRAGPYRTAPRSWPGGRAAWCCRPCCRRAPRRRAAGFPASPPGR